jgi:hypothetical protein
MMTKTQNTNEGITPPTAGEVVELVAAVQAAYSAYGWVEEKQFTRLFDEVARLASVIEEGCDCSVDGPMNWQAEIERLRQRQQPVPPRVGHILRLADIIREVDGNHSLGAAALAEAILSHPDSRWLSTRQEHHNLHYSQLSDD